MVTYNILLMYIFIVSIMFTTKKMDNKKSKILYLVLTFIPLGIIMGLRERNVGTDTYSYCEYFRRMANGTFKTELENNSLVWLIINKALALFGTNDINYIFPLSILVLVLTAKFIYDNSDNVILSVILFILGYYYFSGFNGTRQFLALVLCINSYKYLGINNDSKGRKIKFVLLNLLAVGVHPTSLVFLLVLALIMKPTKKNLFRILIIILITFVAFVPISNILVKYFPHYALYVNKSGITNHGFGVGKNRSFIITIIYMFFEFVMLYLFNHSTKDDERKKLFGFIIVNWIAIVLGCMALQSIMFSRIAWYFNIFSIIYIPYVFKFIKKNQKKFIEIAYIIIMMIPYYIQLTNNISGVLPYYFNF